MTATTNDTFYTELTTRNTGFIPADQQQRLRESAALIAGCGSTGGAVVEPLVRLGIGHLLLADNGAFELNNLNRQHASVADIGRNKAEVAAERVRAINPHLEPVVETMGITADNVDQLVRAADIVIDGVDVTENSGWAAKAQLHAAAVVHARPVISGYDMAGTQFVRFYDYRRPGSRAFDGKITAEHLETATTWSLLTKVIPPRIVPLEMIQNIRDNLDNPGYSVPQLTYSAMLFGVLASRMTAEVLDGKPVRRTVLVDVHHAVRDRRTRARVGAMKMRTLVGASRDIARLRRSSRNTT